MNTIPRIKLTITFQELFTFIWNMLFVQKGPAEQSQIITSFETTFSSRYELPPGIATCKARMGLYHLLKNMNLPLGGEVLISALHVADFINVIHLAGFKPVVIDIEKNSYCMDFHDLEKKITSKSVLFLITHLAGYPHDMQKVLNISNKYHLPFIEDCSQAISSTFHGKPLGTFGSASIFSLSLLKPICTINGGIILSSNTALLNKIRTSISSQKKIDKIPYITEAIKNIILKLAVSPLLFTFIVFPLLRPLIYKDDFFAKFQKHNKLVIKRERLPQHFFEPFTWQQALLGLSQLKTLKEREIRRYNNATRLYSKINNKLIHKPLPHAPQSNHSFWLFPIKTANPANLRNYLYKHGIDCSKMLLSCIPEEIAFTEYSFLANHAKKTKDQTLFIPAYADLKDKDIIHIIDTINRYK
ncbi:MAG: DegT/DnrJ/EryC1/StrS family aminotransferase [Oligoflexia bacterium]|nr:DegT/DnrJ/EryC1/StrS family aminotransferase [Oligoflexia bacterium]